MKISPAHEEDNMSEADQKAEGIEDEDIIKYNQEIIAFNTTDYYGKTKAYNINYNRDMKIEIYRDSDQKLLESYTLTDVKKQFEAEVESLKDYNDPQGVYARCLECKVAQ